MRTLILVLGLFGTAACSSVSSRETDVAARAPSAVRTVTDAEWYANARPETHYVRAIASDDLPRMRQWLALGLPADYKISNVHPSVIQAALSTHRREIVRLLIENPHVSSRPNPHQAIALCPAKEDHLTVNLYEFIVFESANARYERTCRDDDYFLERERNEPTSS